MIKLLRRTRSSRRPSSTRRARSCPRRVSCRRPPSSPSGSRDGEIPKGRDPVLTRTASGAGPAIAAALRVDDGARILRVLYDASSVVAAERMVNVFTFAIPAGAVLPRPPRRPAPEAAPRPARGPRRDGPGGRGARRGGVEPGRTRAALATFRRTIDELRRRSAELEEMRRSAEARADALAVTSQTLVRSHPGGLLVVEASGVWRRRIRRPASCSGSPIRLRPVGGGCARRVAAGRRGGRPRASPASRRWPRGGAGGRDVGTAPGGDGGPGRRRGRDRFSARSSSWKTGRR